MLMNFSCKCTFIYLYIDIDLVGDFLCVSLSVSLSLSLLLVALWHPNENLLRPRTLFVSGHLLVLPPLVLLHLTSGSFMIKLVRTFQRTFLDATFIQNTKPFFWIFPILTFPLSSTVGVRSHCMASWSPVFP